MLWAVQQSCGMGGSFAATVACGQYNRVRLAVRKQRCAGGARALLQAELQKQLIGQLVSPSSQSWPRHSEARTSGSQVRRTAASAAAGGES
jgi:hypothetical protein